MHTKVTHGVRISVETNYNEKLSYVEGNSFVFEYQITIHNSNDDDVQLLSRQWYIFDSLDEPHVIEGLGVVGEQPLLQKNEQHQYKSYCELKSEIGYMEGNYTFINRSTNKRFKVTIPRFELIFPGKMN